MKSLDITNLLNVPEMPELLTQVEQKLVEFTTNANPALQIPITRLIHAKSKRLRSMLVIAVTNSQDKPIDEKVLAGCAAIELTHIASLVHDDIIDEAQTRWGIPTVSSQEGLNHAILVGDYLFARSGVAAATINSEAAHLMSTAMADLIDGESREVAEEYNMSRSVDSLITSLRGKTAALIGASCRMGGLCAGLAEEQLDALTRYGEAFGIAFQLVDDILDLLSTPELMGKPIGNDMKEGVYTLPLITTLGGSRANEARTLLENKDYDRLKGLLIEDGSIQKTIAETVRYSEQAVKELEILAGSSSLAALPKAYLEWAFSNLVADEYSHLTIL